MFTIFAPLINSTTMDEDIRDFLSQIEIERMELKSSLFEISFLMKVKQNADLTRQLDRILDRLNYLEKLEKEIRKRI
jgi:hypothetical protein